MANFMEILNDRTLSERQRTISLALQRTQVLVELVELDVISEARVAMVTNAVIAVIDELGQGGPLGAPAGLPSRNRSRSRSRSDGSAASSGLSDGAFY